MDRDDAFNKLVECVEKVGSGSFENVEQAFVVAAQALNYIMDDIDGSSNKESD